MLLRLGAVLGLVAGSLIWLSATNPAMPCTGNRFWTPWNPDFLHTFTQAWGTVLPITPTRPADPAKLSVPPAFKIERAFLVCQSNYAIGLEVWGEGNWPLQGQMVTLLAINNHQKFGWAQQEMVGWGGDFKAQLILGLVAQTQGYKAAVVWRGRAWWMNVGPCATKASLPELGKGRGG